MDAGKRYWLETHLGLPYSQAVNRVTEALKEEGFGVITEIDVPKIFKTKLDKDFRKYAILGACNPKLSYRALTADLEAGLLLPCNVVVYEDETGSAVRILDPQKMIGVAGNSGLDDVAVEARERLERVVARLEGRLAEESVERKAIDDGA